MIAAINRLGWTHPSCFGHNLNLAVTNALKDESRVARAVGVCKKVVQHFAHSYKQRRCLIEAKITKLLPQHTLTDILLGGNHNTKCFHAFLNKMQLYVWF